MFELGQVLRPEPGQFQFDPKMLTTRYGTVLLKNVITADRRRQGDWRQRPKMLTTRYGTVLLKNVITADRRCQGDWQKIIRDTSGPNQRF